MGALISLFGIAFLIGERACERPGACMLREAAVRTVGPVAAGSAEARALEVAAFMPVRVGDAPTAYPRFNPFLHSIDTFVPILDLNTESFWRADREVLYAPQTDVGAAVAWALRLVALSDTAGRVRLGWMLYLMGIVERLLGAVIVAIAIVGFTGLVRREDAV